MPSSSSNSASNELPKASTALLLLASVIFALAYSQAPLYTDNQHTYLLHGLTDAGFGDLDLGWMATTVDPFLVFSFFVSSVFEFLHSFLFLLMCFVLLFLYFFSIVKVVYYSCDFLGRSQRIFLLFGIVLIHSSYFSRSTSQVVGLDLRQIFTEGVASQYILGSVLQPSMFGVLLIVSISLFLRENRFVAVLFAVLAAVFHSTYLLSAATLVLAYMIIMYRRGEALRNIIGLGAFALVIVSPVVFYAVMNFGPSTTDSYQLAQQILVDGRIRHHADPGTWFSIISVLQFSLVALAAWLYRYKEIVIILLVGVVVSTVLTAVQLLSGSDFIALVFPWRMSVWLVPISTCLLVARFVPLVLIWWGRLDSDFLTIQRLEYVVLSLAAMLAIFGILVATIFSDDPLSEEAQEVMAYVENSRVRGDIYLVPTGAELHSFRLETGAPIVVDFKTHPYRDVEVLEWFERLQRVDAFYASRDVSKRCGELESMVNEYGVTHVVDVVLRREGVCPSMVKTFENERYILYEVQLD